MKLFNYAPAWHCGFKPSEFEIEEAKDLLELDFVKKWVTDDNFSSIKISNNLIIAVKEKGESWIIIGSCNNEVSKVLTNYFGEWVAYAP